MSKFDQNMTIQTTFREKDIRFYSANSEYVSLHGVWYENGTYRRMPKDVAEATNWRVAMLYTHTSGARLRFCTDSPYIAVGAIYPPMEFSSPKSASLSSAGAFCFDMYADGKHCRVLLPQKTVQRGSVVSFDVEGGQYESFMSFSSKRMREITLCFPSFVDMSELYIGLKEGSKVEEGREYVNENGSPVVFYGSSITQGACASRSGNIYQNVLSRKFNFDYVNLGFAGACKAEDAIIDYLCSLDMSVLVFDYDHNTPNAEHLRRTHLPALRKLRAAHPDVPIVLMSKPNIHSGVAEAIERKNVIEDSYRALKSESDTPVYFVDGQKIFESCDSEMMTVDNTHPTDLGFYCMAKALEGIFEELGDYIKDN